MLTDHQIRKLAKLIAADPAMPQRSTTWMPGRPPRPCPPLLNAAEAIALLRLDEAGLRNPERSLRHYVDSGRIVGRRVGRRVLYPLPELLNFINTGQG